MSQRQTLLLDAGWKFHLGDIDPPIANTHIAAYMANKAGFARGAAKPSYDDSDWREVDLPHDWAVEGTFGPDNHVDSGFLPRGIGWYRRHFQINESDRGKHLELHFDGVATHCTVYVNGHLLHRNFCGYTPFTIDISDIASFGDTLNVIAVRVDASYMEGWWYEGAGIYRHVYLRKTSPVHVATDGVFVRPTRTFDNEWNTEVETALENTSNAAIRCTVRSTLQKKGVRFTYLCNGSRKNEPGNPGETAKISEPDPLFLESVIELAARSKQVMHQTIRVSNPALWSCSEPNLYEIHSEILDENEVVDESRATFGYRTIRFDPNEGFFLNEKPLKLLGTCNHQDHAGVGVAVPDSIHEFRILRLKEMGSNAYRCAHNPPAMELLDACDRLGMFVMDETRNFGSSPEHLEQLRTMVRRDRNHPCVILWSICNEESIQGEPVGARIARTMIEEIRNLDPSRPITAAVSGGILNDDCIAAEIEVMGINYQLQTYDPFHAKHPTKPIVASETHCALSTRGVYRRDGLFFASYDTEKAFWGNTARETWRAISSRPFVAGMFAWTGFDYRGEPSPHHWPCVSSHWGILDTCGFAKDAFYLHKAWFTREPFVHLLPHWNWREGDEVKVAAYTNCDEVEFFLNDEPLGRKRVDAIDMVEWTIPFRPGKLKAHAFRLGQPLAEAVIETTGAATALGLEIHPSFDSGRWGGHSCLPMGQTSLSVNCRMDNNVHPGQTGMSTPPIHVIPADGEFAIPITVFATDAEGRRVPDASHRVTFSIEGPARILGVGNGDPTCHEPDRASARSLFNGLAQVILQTTDSAGRCVLRASADGLAGAELLLESTAASVRPSAVAPVIRQLISDWRMSPISPDRPDPNQTLSLTDMNTWQRIDPSRGPQSFTLGYAIYRATFTPPRILQPTGGRILFHEIAGEAEILPDCQLVRRKPDPSPSSVEILFAATSQKLTLSVLIRSDTSPAGIGKAVEILSR